MPQFVTNGHVLQSMDSRLESTLAGMDWQKHASKDVAPIAGQLTGQLISTATGGTRNGDGLLGDTSTMVHWWCTAPVKHYPDGKGFV